MCKGKGSFKPYMRTIRQTLQKMKKKSSGADHLTFVGGRGGMGDLVWVRIFPPNLWRKNFFPDIQQCKTFFSSIIHNERYFFQCRNFFPLGISLQGFFPLEISLQDIFSQITYTPLPPPPPKVKWSAPKITSFEQHFSAKFLGVK